MTRWSDCIGRTRGSIDAHSHTVLIRRSVVVNIDKPSEVNFIDRTEMVSGDWTVFGLNLLLSNVKWLLDWSNRIEPLGCTLTLRNVLSVISGRNRVILVGFGNSGYSMTYPRDVTTTRDLVDLKCIADTESGNGKDVIVVAASSGSTTI